MSFETTKVVIEGELAGVLWMPAVECVREFSVTFTPEQLPFTEELIDLRSCLLRITNEGDFRACWIICARMTVHRTDEMGESRTRTVELDTEGANADCFGLDPFGAYSIDDIEGGLTRAA